MWIALFLASSALAGTEYAVCLVEASAVTPVDGDMGVPIDAVPGVLLPTNCPDLEIELASTLRTEAGAVVHEETWSASSLPPLHHLQGLAELTAETAYILTVNSADGSIQYEGSFTTGREPADALEGFPSLQFVEDVVWRAEETFAVVEVLLVTDSAARSD